MEFRRFSDYQTAASCHWEKSNDAAAITRHILDKKNAQLKCFSNELRMIRQLYLFASMLSSPLSSVSVLLSSISPPRRIQIAMPHVRSIANRLKPFAIDDKLMIPDCAPWALFFVLRDCAVSLSAFLFILLTVGDPCNHMGTFLTFCQRGKRACIYARVREDVTLVHESFILHCMEVNLNCRVLSLTLTWVTAFAAPTGTFKPLGTFHDSYRVSPVMGGRFLCPCTPCTSKRSFKWIDNGKVSDFLVHFPLYLKLGFFLPWAQYWIQSCGNDKLLKLNSFYVSYVRGILTVMSRKLAFAFHKKSLLTFPRAATDRRLERCIELSTMPDKLDLRHDVQTL